MTTSRRFRSAEERYERLLLTQSLLAQATREIGPAQDLQPVLETVLRALRSMLDFAGGSICLVDEGRIHVAAADPPVSEEVAALRLPVGTGLAGRCIGSGKVVYSPDVAVDPRVDPVVWRTGSNDHIASYLAVPLICLGEVIGAVQVDSIEVDAFDEEDVTMLEGLAAQAAGAIESARRFEEIMQLERMKSDFIGRVSHELQTPITIIGGFVATLLERGDDIDAGGRQRMLERVDGAVARLAGLISDLLMFSRLEAGVLVAAPENVRVLDVLEQVRRESSSPGDVDIDCDPGLRLRTDPSLLRRGLGFLVDNALKYAGDAVLRARPRVIEVLDHGPGIPEHLQPVIFERFTRGEEMTTVPGMGNGLPIARTLLAAVGADLVLVPGAHRSSGCQLQIRFPGG